VARIARFPTGPEGNSNQNEAQITFSGSYIVIAVSPRSNACQKCPRNVLGTPTTVELVDWICQAWQKVTPEALKPYYSSPPILHSETLPFISKDPNTDSKQPHLQGLYPEEATWQPWKGIFLLRLE